MFQFDRTRRLRIPRVAATIECNGTILGKATASSRIEYYYYNEKHQLWQDFGGIVIVIVRRQARHSVWIVQDCIPGVITILRRQARHSVCLLQGGHCL
jgi:hypothetical protein